MNRIYTYYPLLGLEILRDFDPASLGWPSKRKLIKQKFDSQGKFIGKKFCNILSHNRQSYKIETHFLFTLFNYKLLLRKIKHKC